MWTRGCECLCQLPRMPGKPRPKWNHLVDKEALWKVPSCSGRGEAADHVERAEGPSAATTECGTQWGGAAPALRAKTNSEGSPPPKGPVLFLALLWGEHLTRDPASPGLFVGNAHSVVDTGTPPCSRARGSAAPRLRDSARPATPPPCPSRSLQPPFCSWLL